MIVCGLYVFTMVCDKKIKRRLQERDKVIKNSKHLSSCQEHIYIAVTRFNATTWEENTAYRGHNNIAGCIYGSPIEISHTIPINAELYVIEMNNTTNEIMGIGKLYNRFVYKTHRKHMYKIYEDRNYSRYVYSGDKRIDKSAFTDELKLICWFLEHVLFYGYGPLDKPKRGTHLKRGMGINKLPPALLKANHGITLNLDHQIKYYFNACAGV